MIFILWSLHYNFPPLFPQYKKIFSHIYFDTVDTRKQQY